MNFHSRVRCHECEALNEPSALFCARCGAALQTAASSSPRPRRKRVSSNGAAFALAIFVLLLTTVFVLGVIVYRTTRAETTDIDPLAGRPGTTATTAPPAGEGGSGGSSDGGASNTPVRGVIIRPQAAVSSSALTPTSRGDYRAPNLLDENPATSWNEGADGPGIGEWVRFEFDEPVVLTRIEFLNGCQKDEERFYGHIRVRSLKLEYSGGYTQLVDLLDTMDAQAVTARSKATEWLKMTITGVYPDYIWEDAALSEVRLFELAGQQ